MEQMVAADGFFLRARRTNENPPETARASTGGSNNGRTPYTATATCRCRAWLAHRASDYRQYAIEVPDGCQWAPARAPRRADSSKSATAEEDYLEHAADHSGRGSTSGAALATLMENDRRKIELMSVRVAAGFRRVHGDETVLGDNYFGDRDGTARLRRSLDRNLAAGPGRRPAGAGGIRRRTNGGHPGHAPSL